MDKKKVNPVKRFWYRHPIICNAVLILIVIPLFFWLMLVFVDFWTHHGETAVVPRVKGMPFQKALDELEAADLAVVVSDSVYDEHKAPGSIVDIQPQPGAVVKAGREVYLTIVAFSPKQIVFDVPLTDISSRQAISHLQSLGFKDIQIKYVPSPYPDLVVAVKHNGRAVNLGNRVPANAVITLEVGRGDSDMPAPSTTLDDVITTAIGATAQPDVTADDDEVPSGAEEPEDDPDVFD